LAIKEELLSLLERDKEFRYAVAGLLGLGEVLRRLDEHGERLVRIEEELVKLREDMNKGFELVNRHISALGAKWGMMAEGAFREGLRGLLERELGLRVERWIGFDEEGLVHGYPKEVEVDVAVKDEKIILIEVSSHARGSDVSGLKRKAGLYQRRTGRKPDRLVIVTPYADSRALEASKRLEVEIHTSV
jgi:hypothetical protein